MKKIILSAMIVSASSFAQASQIYALVKGELATASTVRISGAAAQELYAQLNIEETEVRDEHGGPVTGQAKYGKNVTCVHEYNRYECEIK